jgi:CreA protein
MVGLQPSRTRDDRRGQHELPLFDRERNVLVYVAYSDRVLTGSPQNSISTVPIMGWAAP